MKRECGSSGFTYWLFGFYLLGCDCNHAIQKPEEQTHDMVVRPGALCTYLPVPRLWSRADPGVGQEAPWGPVLLGGIVSGFPYRGSHCCLRELTLWLISWWFSPWIDFPVLMSLECKFQELCKGRKVCPSCLCCILAPPSSGFLRAVLWRAVSASHQRNQTASHSPFDTMEGFYCF